MKLAMFIPGGRAVKSTLILLLAGLVPGLAILLAAYLTAR